MGQKTNPIANRLGGTKGHLANWFAKNKQDFVRKLQEDWQIRAYLNKRFIKIIAKIIIERASESTTITIYASQPGILIGPGGQKIQEIKADLKKLIGKGVYLNVLEVKTPELDARLVAQNIADQIAARASYKRAGSRAVEDAMHIGAGGIKVCISGRLGGAEIARSVCIKKGRVPCQTLRADVDFALAEARTLYGTIGVKVWIFTREVYGKRDLSLKLETLKRSKRRKGST